MSANAGLAVTKDEDVRLTCPAHIFDGVSTKVGYHGHTIIGELEQTLGEDIGLIDPVVPLSNAFLSLDCVARNILKMEKIVDDDIVQVDSCFTGPQNMLFAGNRTGKRKRRGPPDPTYPNWYVMLEQGIFTTSEPVVTKPPVVRKGMCGTPLVLIGNKNKKEVGVGDVVGFLLWAELKGAQGRMLYSYAQPADPLIERGWELAQVD
jgi:hypothetical protein